MKYFTLVAAIFYGFAALGGTSYSVIQDNQGLLLVEIGPQTANEIKSILESSRYTTGIKSALVTRLLVNMSLDNQVLLDCQINKDGLMKCERHVPVENEYCRFAAKVYSEKSERSVDQFYSRCADAASTISSTLGPNPASFSVAEIIENISTAFRERMFQ